MHTWSPLYSLWPLPILYGAAVAIFTPAASWVSAKAQLEHPALGLAFPTGKLWFRKMGKAKQEKGACKSLTPCYCCGCFSTVVLPVLFNEELKNVESEEGGTAVLHCEISKPGAPVEWRKGGVIIQPSDKYEMKLKGSIAELIIHGVEPDDCGDYTCSTGYEITTGSVYVQGKMKLDGNALILLPEFLTTIFGSNCPNLSQMQTVETPFISSLISVKI